jgi:hypothetical protein
VKPITPITPIRAMKPLKPLKSLKPVKVADGPARLVETCEIYTQGLVMTCPLCWLPVKGHHSCRREST